jgi:GTP-binding protein
VKVLNADFVTSAARADGIPRDEVARVALAGRSNVGKSSLINALCRSKIARTSAAPGKTRLVNFYRITMEGGPGGPGRWPVYLVDLPGYGYARGGGDAADELAGIAHEYYADCDRRARNLSSASWGDDGRTAIDARLKSRALPSPSATLLLIDSRHPGLESDRAAADWLNRLGVTYQVVATKIDKLARSERAKNLKTLETTFATAVVPVSATSGEGLDELWRTIARLARSAE